MERKTEPLEEEKCGKGGVHWFGGAVGSPAQRKPNGSEMIVKMSQKTLDFLL